MSVPLATHALVIHPSAQHVPQTSEKRQREKTDDEKEKEREKKAETRKAARC